MGKRAMITRLETQMEERRHALDNQAKEYERRLAELNHAHQQQLDRNAQYVSRETWEVRNAQQDEWRREIDKWRWISIGAALISGGLAAKIMTLLK